jgi:hypothetical protein
MEEAFYMESVPRFYNQDQLAVSVRELFWFSRYELLLLDVGSWGRGQFGNPEEGERCC